MNTGSPPPIPSNAVADCDLDTTVQRMAAETLALMAECGRSNPLLIGIHSGGVTLAEQLSKHLKLTSPQGSLDIAFYRDDFSQIGLNPTVQPSELPEDTEGRHIILVDDILYTGRTIRAALNELFDYGRPASVTLVVLVDRGERQIPVHADITGIAVELEAGEHIKLSPELPLSLAIGLPPNPNPTDTETPSTSTNTSTKTGKP